MSHNNDNFFPGFFDDYNERETSIPGALQVAEPRLHPPLKFISINIPCRAAINFSKPLQDLLVPCVVGISINWRIQADDQGVRLFSTFWSGRHQYYGTKLELLGNAGRQHDLNDESDTGDDDAGKQEPATHPPFQQSGFKI